MGKLFGILAILVGVWLGLRVLTEGEDSVFTAPLPQAAAPAPSAATLKRIRNQLEEDRDLGLERLERGLKE